MISIVGGMLSIMGECDSWSHQNMACQRPVVDSLGLKDKLMLSQFMYNNKESLVKYVKPMVEHKKVYWWDIGGKQQNTTPCN